MICPSTEELAAIYDGNLKSKQAAKVREHIASCPRCAHDLKVLHQSLQQVKNTPHPPEELLKSTLVDSQKKSPTSRVNLLLRGRRQESR